MKFWSEYLKSTTIKKMAAVASDLEVSKEHSTPSFIFVFSLVYQSGHMNIVVVLVVVFKRLSIGQRLAEPCPSA
jgi:hypothetical protein